MEFRIQAKDKAKRLRDPHYKVTWEFMEGDADGSQHATSTFLDTPEGIDQMKTLIKAWKVCEELNGCDYNDFRGNAYYDAFFSNEEVEDYSNYDHIEGLWVDDDMVDDETAKKVMDAYFKEINPYNLGFEHPTDSNYICTSFRDFTVNYIDENGDASYVDVIFTKEELKEFKELY